MSVLKDLYSVWKYRNNPNQALGCERNEKQSRIDLTDGINLRLQKVTGGLIIQSSIYDYKNDNHKNSTYIITDEKDLGTEINKIITMEILKQ